MEVRRPSMASMLPVRTADSKHGTGQQPPPSVQSGPAASTPVPVPQQGDGERVEHVLWMCAEGMAGDMRDLAQRSEHYVSTSAETAYQTVRNNPRAAALAAAALLVGGGFTLAALAIKGRL